VTAAFAKKKSAETTTEHYHIDASCWARSIRHRSRRRRGFAKTEIEIFSHIRKSEFKSSMGPARTSLPSSLVQGEDSLLQPLLCGTQRFERRLIRAQCDYMRCCHAGRRRTKMDIRTNRWSDPYVIRRRNAARRGQALAAARAMSGACTFTTSPGLTWKRTPAQQ